MGGIPLSYKWHAQNYSKFRIEKWADEVVVFNPLSGETHQLNEFSANVLDLIRRPCTLNALSDQIHTLYEIEDRKKLTKQLESLIRQFDDIGLIEPYLK